MNNLSRIIILRYGLNNPVSNSVIFNRILSQIGYFGNPVDIILEMEQEGLVTHKGYIDATSGVLKEIKTTQKGKQVFFNEVQFLLLPKDISEPIAEFLNKILKVNKN